MPYLMEHPDESARLVAKVDAERWTARYLDAHLAGCARVLEVGCGPCHLLGALPSDLVRIGVDLSGTRLRRAAPSPTLATAQADAVRLPFTSDSFDLVYSRFLLEYIDARRGAVAEMARVCATGGTVVLQDLDGQLFWHDGEDQALREDLAYIQPRLEAMGFDPFVGRKLRRLARDAGLVDVTVSVEPYHLIDGSIDPVQHRQWHDKLRIAQPTVERLLGSAQESHRFVERFMAHLESPDTLTYSNMFTIAGRVPQRSVA
jgi:SAM-dependent methyltransferase